MINTQVAKVLNKQHPISALCHSSSQHLHCLVITLTRALLNLPRPTDAADKSKTVSYTTNTHKKKLRLRHIFAPFERAQHPASRNPQNIHLKIVVLSPEAVENFFE